ncbi:MAG: cell division protein FtsQ, partial [Chitinophagaceae bacterium]
MLNRINWAAIFKGLCWVVTLAGLIVLMSFVEGKKQSQKCTDVKILIPGAGNFIEREEITNLLQQNFGELRGRDLHNISIHEIEQQIQKIPYIAAVKVYAEMDGIIKIKVQQRQPVLRIINAGQQDFYLDNEGNKMPVSSNFTANVLVATGSIGEGFNGKVESFNSALVRDLYKTAMFIRQDTLW